MMIMMKGSAEQHLAEHNTLGAGARAKELSSRLTDALCSKRALFSLFHVRWISHIHILAAQGFFCPRWHNFVIRPNVSASMQRRFCGASAGGECISCGQKSGAKTYFSTLSS
jgi:hypothetical protein